MVQRRAWRIHKFGTVLLSAEMRASLWLILRLKVQATRGYPYYSEERLPPQTVHGFVTCRDSRGYVSRSDFQWRFDQQRWLIWDTPADALARNQCFSINELRDDLLDELAKKPNTPPLAPSLPNTEDKYFNRPRTIIHGVDSISVFTRQDLDFDLELEWEASAPFSGCNPEPEELPREPAPLENALPEPGGDNGPAPPPPDAVAPLPPNAPPLGGTSAVPEGFSPGDQSQVGSSQYFVKMLLRYDTTAGQGVLPQPAIFDLGPFPGVVPPISEFSLSVEEESPSSGCYPGFFFGRYTLRRSGAPLEAIGPACFQERPTILAIVPA